MLDGGGSASAGGGGGSNMHSVYGGNSGYTSIPTGLGAASSAAAVNGMGVAAGDWQSIPPDMLPGSYSTSVAPGLLMDPTAAAAAYAAAFPSVLAQPPATIPPAVLQPDSTTVASLSLGIPSGTRPEMINAYETSPSPYAYYPTFAPYAATSTNRTSPSNESSHISSGHEGVSPADSGAGGSSGTGPSSSPLSIGFSQPNAFYLPGPSVPGGGGGGAGPAGFDGSWQSTTILPGSSTLSSMPRPKKRACEQCNLSKVKCDFQSPCQKCAARKINCTYPPPRKTSSKDSASPVAHLGGTVAPSSAPPPPPPLTDQHWRESQAAVQQVFDGMNAGGSTMPIAQSQQLGNGPFTFPPHALQMRSREDDAVSVYSEFGSATTRPSGSDSRRTSVANSIILDADPNLAASLAMAGLDVNDLQELLPAVQQQMQNQVVAAQQGANNASREDLPTMVPGNIHPQDPEVGNRVRQAWKSFIAQSQTGFNLSPVARAAAGLQPNGSDPSFGDSNSAAQGSGKPETAKRPSLLHRGRSNSLPSSNYAPYLQQALIAAMAQSQSQQQHADHPLSRDNSKGSAGESSSSNVDDELQANGGGGGGGSGAKLNRPSMSALQPPMDPNDHMARMLMGQQQARGGTKQTLAPERPPSFLNTPIRETPKIRVDGGGGGGGGGAEKTTSAFTRPGNKRLASQTLVPDISKRVDTSNGPPDHNRNSVPNWIGFSDLPLADILANAAMPTPQGNAGGQYGGGNYRMFTPGGSFGMDTPGFPGLTPTMFDPFSTSYGFDLVTPSGASALRQSYLSNTTTATGNDPEPVSVGRGSI